MLAGSKIVAAACASEKLSNRLGITGWLSRFLSFSILKFHYFKPFCDFFKNPDEASDQKID